MMCYKKENSKHIRKVSYVISEAGWYIYTRDKIRISIMNVRVENPLTFIHSGSFSYFKLKLAIDKFVYCIRSANIKIKFDFRRRV